MIDWTSKTAEKVTMSREGSPQSKLLNDELTLKVKLGPKGVRFSKNTKKGEDEIGEPGGEVAEETNSLNVERQKKSMSMCPGLYTSTCSIPMKKDKEISTNVDLQVLFVSTLSIHVCSFLITEGCGQELGKYLQHHNKPECWDPSDTGNLGRDLGDHRSCIFLCTC